MVDVPSVFVTVTATEPELCAGVVARIVVELLTVMELAASPPNVTDAPDWKFVPVSVTWAPPAAGPDMGETLAMVRFVDP